LETHELEKLCETFLAEKDIAKATLKSYRNTFKKYIAYLKEEGIDFARTSDIIQYRKMLRSHGYSTYYIYIQISELKSLYRYLRLNQKHLDLPMEYAHDIMARVKNERIKRRITKPVLTLEQAKILILKTKTNRKSIWQYRDHAIIYLMLTSGARSQEIIDARKEDYQGKAGEKILYLRNMEEKLSYEFVKIAPGGEAAIDDYIRMRKDKNPYLFVTTKNTSPKQKLSTAFFQRMLKRVLKSCGLENIALTPHSLRHTVATFNLLRGGSITQTKESLRHKNIQSTYVYVDHLERLKDDSENEIERYILNEDI